jgi:NAD+ synthase
MAGLQSFAVRLCAMQDGLFNAVFVLDDGAVKAVRHKVNLPNYGVFDDKRNFSAGSLQGPVSVRGWRVGLAICEDIWSADVCEVLSESGAEIILSLNASPFEAGKTDQRMSHAVARMTESGLPIIYVNMVGGQDELVFDGGSFGPQPRRQARLPNAAIHRRVICQLQHAAVRQARY